MITGLESLGRYCHFAIRAFFAALGSIFHPGELGRQFYRIYVGAIPLAAVTGLALGVVIWLHLHGVLLRFGPGYVQLLPQALSLAVVLEFAPIGAGFIVAGRSGASLGAELGSMRLSEQIDALECLGVSPMKVLVGPRVLGCILALPLLTVIIAFLAIMGGFGAELLGGKMYWAEFQSACLKSLHLREVIPAILKTTVFGYLVAVTGCFHGFQAEGGTEGLGRAATRSVVMSIFLVVVSNVFLVRLIQMFV